MKCILECIPQTNSCGALSLCMSQCTLCPFPAVDFTADVTYSETAPLTVTFTRTVSYPDNCGRVVSYWDFGDGEGAYDPSEVVRHTYSSEGEYSVELRVTNAAGPGIKHAENLILIGEPPVDDDTLVDDDIIADDDAIDDDAADDDAADDDTDGGDDDAGAGGGDDDQADEEDDEEDSGGCGC